MPKTNFCKPQNNEDIFNNAQNIYYDTEENKKNKNFVQLYDDANNYILQLTEINPTASKIFLFLARFAESNNTIDISMKELANIFNCDESTIKRHLRKLREINFLTTIKVGKKNIYFLNPKIVFNNKAQFKQKMLNTYKEYAGKTDINFPIDNDIVNTEEIEKFKKREKLTYRFKLKNTEFKEPTMDEIVEDLHQKELLNEDIKQLRKKLIDLQAQIMINEQTLKIQTEEGRNPTFEDLASNDLF